MIKQLTTKIVYQNPWMKVLEDEVEFQNGHKGIYGVVDKSDFALIIPFDGKKFHLVKQYRYPTKQESIEFPQGKHENNPDEDSIHMARTELLEETGFEARKLTHIGFLHEAPGYSNQGFHIYLATQLTKKETKLDVTEAGLERLELTLQEFLQAIKNSEITDAPTISAYGLLIVKFPEFINQHKHKLV
jgi:8-oxo-dGTP pyrophosphatase MutT (NUDIX family)